MEHKLKDLSSKVIVGGVNLLEKAEHQQQLLELAAREMAKRKKKEAKLSKQLHKSVYSEFTELVYCCVAGRRQNVWIWRRSMPVYRRRLQLRQDDSRKCGDSSNKPNKRSALIRTPLRRCPD